LIATIILRVWNCRKIRTIQTPNSDICPTGVVIEYP